MSESVPSVLNARERARQYWESDGFYEIVAGIGSAILGLALWLDPQFSHFVSGENGGKYLWYAAGLLSLSAKRITEWLKVRFTYPRTGYVAPPQQTDVQINEKAFPRPKMTRDQAVDSFLAVTFVLLVLGIVLNHRWMLWLFIFLHIYLCWHFRNWVPISWYKKYLPPIIGFLLIILPLNFNLAGAIVVIAAGLHTISQGMRKMVLYFKEHPVQRA